MSIIIYQAEKDANLTDVISKARSISYHSKLEHYDLSPAQKLALKTAASLDNYSVDVDGLYPTKSILVSTVWNLNDDVFTKEEVWQARHTPKDKPTNDNHIENAIVGHITGNWVIDQEGNEIPDDIAFDLLPDLYHIFNTAVIYAAFSEKEPKDRADRLIAAIEAGEKYVSMEAYFKGFDYALKNLTTGQVQILERNASTAFLTKHLRAYGGDGEYQDYKLGRVLRSITFSGKGYVDKPANPQSIIFDKNTMFDFISKGYSKDFGVLNIQKPNNGELETMSVELETQVTELTTANTTLKSDIVAKEAVIAGLKSEIETLATVKTNLESEVASLKATNETLTAERDAAKAECDDMKKDMEKKEKKTARKAKLMAEDLYSDEEAEAKIAAFEALSDEQFDVVANELVEARKAIKSAAIPTPEVIPEPSPVPEPTAASLLDNVVVETVVVPVAVDESTARIREGVANLIEKSAANLRPSKSRKNK